MTSIKQSLLILGHGQLGLMMAEAAVKYGRRVDRFDLASNKVLLGTSQIAVDMTIEEILATYDVITAELEHLPQTEAVTKLLASPQWLQPQAFEVLPSRDSQKAHLDAIGVLSAKWQKINDRSALEQAFADMGDHLVVKTVRGGYDGKGQWVINAAEIGQIPEGVFGQIIAEEKVAFKHEVSIIGARSRNGDVVCLPLALNVHDEGILRYSRAPYDDADLQQQAQQMLETVMESLAYVGVMAIECFVVDDKLLVNEIAPRVHNSGHWSQLGALYSQFDLHIRACFDLPLPKVLNSQETVMLNLIGCELNADWWQLSDVTAHWYGKEIREKRKLGHINIDISEYSRNQAQSSEQSILPDPVIALLEQLDMRHAGYLRQAFSDH